LAAEIARSTGTDTVNFQTLDGYITVEKDARIARDEILTNTLNATGTDLYARMLVLENIISSLRGESVYAVVQATYTAV
jgi:hypothetical protein